MKNKGITLIALVITIVILLILAGITINSLTNSGLLGKAQESTKISEIKEIEEAARISYMERQMEEVVGGEQVTIAGVISDLREKGYKIKEITGEANSITGIALSEENVTVKRNTEKTVTYTLIYSEETTVRYFVEVQGKDYEILFDNGNITVNTEETKVGEISKEPEVTVTSSDSTTIEANKTEEGKIVLTAKDKIGNVEITIKEINSNVTKTFTVNIVLESLSFANNDMNDLYNSNIISTYGNPSPKWIGGSWCMIDWGSEKGRPNDAGLIIDMDLINEKYREFQVCRDED